MYSVRNKVKRFVAFGIFGLAFFFAVGYLVMLLWNALIPEIFDTSQITYWQAVGLLILSKILFGGFRPGGHRMRRNAAWKRKWMQMSEEERQEFRKKWRERWENKKSES